MFETFEKFFNLNALDKTGNETVPTAIPAIANLFDIFYPRNINMKQHQTEKMLLLFLLRIFICT